MSVWLTSHVPAFGASRGSVVGSTARNNASCVLCERREKVLPFFDLFVYLDISWCFEPSYITKGYIMDENKREFGCPCYSAHKLQNHYFYFFY